MVARSVMVKSERYFDLYDQVFARYFRGVEYDDQAAEQLTEAMISMIEEWLEDPLSYPGLTEDEKALLKQMTPEELERYFLDRLREQSERHDGGNRWIGTGGTSPVGHSGFRPGGMRVGGSSGMKSAVKVALERRYSDYSKRGVLSPETIGDALSRLKRMIPWGPKNELNIDKTIYETVRQAGEIEIVFDRSMKNKVKVILMMDNGGWSMDPYVEVCKLLFNYASFEFKDLRTFYFHNCVYDRVWEDPQRYFKPMRTADFAQWDPEYKLVVVGDASMALYELIDYRGNIEMGEYQTRSGRDWLAFLARQFRHAVWLNPKLENEWLTTPGSRTIAGIRQVFPMFELTVDGLERAVDHLMAK